MFDKVIERSIKDPTQLMDARMFDVKPEHVVAVFNGKGRLAEISRTHWRVTGNSMTILEPDFIMFLDANVTTKLPVLLTVLLSNVALTKVNFVGDIMTEAIGVFAETSFPICTTKLSVVIAKGGLIMLSSFMTMLLTKVLLGNRLLIVNYLPDTVQMNPEAEVVEPSETVMSTELHEGLANVY